MLISDALANAKKILKSRLEAELLLSFALGKKRERVFAHPEIEITGVQARKWRTLCMRRQRGEPIAYLVKHKEFFGLDFYVDKRVLIPRPETEILVEEVIGRCQAIPKDDMNFVEGCSGPSICDVGTGSGCIAVALAKNLPMARITALDISAGALAVAERNAKTHGVADRIEFVKSNLLSAVMDMHFDVIVANLPYISDGDSHVEIGVKKYEPKRALFAGRTGLELFEKLFGQISKMPTLPRFIICEAGWNQKRALLLLSSNIFPNRPQLDIMWKKDLAGVNRVIIIKILKHV